MKQYPEEMRQKVVARYLEGYSSKEVGKEFEMSYGTVIRWVHEAGYDKVKLKKLRFDKMYEKGEEQKAKLQRDMKRKLKQIEIYCEKIRELSSEVNEWISDKGE